MDIQGLMKHKRQLEKDINIQVDKLLTEFEDTHKIHHHFMSIEIRDHSGGIGSPDLRRYHIGVEIKI